MTINLTPHLIAPRQLFITTTFLSDSRPVLIIFSLQTEYRAITVFVSMSPQTIYMSGLDPHGDNMDIPVRALDCDTITQVKDKALDTIYRAVSYSSRPKHSDLDLEWRTGTSGRLILYDEDSTTKTEGDWKRVNTLNHYRVPDGALLTLIPKQSSMYNISTMSDKSDRHLYHKYETLNISKMSGGQSPPLSRATSPLNHDYDSGIKVSIFFIMSPLSL